MTSRIHRGAGAWGLALLLLISLGQRLQAESHLPSWSELVPGTYLEPEKPVAWGKTGEPVRYHLAGLPLAPEVEAVRGDITDAEDRPVASVRVNRADWDQGWSWNPNVPGYYQVEFFAEGNGTTTRLERVYRLKVIVNKATREFHQEKQGFAVVPDKPFPSESSHQFGFDTYTSDPEVLKLAQLVGFDLVRLTAHWGPDYCGMVPDEVIEGTQGTYNWVGFDRLVNMYSGAGFTIYGQIFGTPVWASPHPEENGKINICVNQVTTYAPTEMEAWGKFVENLVSRYKDRIRLWELWNEPAMPGGSCFWMDTPENYVKLLQTGYAAVKRAQPESQVWIGGQGATPFYYAFYDKVLSLGGGNYFDGLSLHGSWNSPKEGFRDIEKRQNVAPKPAFNSEWHAILQGNMQQGPILSEQALTYRMMTDLMYQLKQGMNRTILFEMKNLIEKEAVLFCKENKWFIHSSGIFRSTPQTEPRLPGVVLADFLIATGRQAAFVREFALSDNAVALELSTANGPMAVFWTEKTALTAEEVRGIASPQSVLADWEGKPIDLSAEPRFENKRMYYLSAPDREKLAALGSADRLVSPRAAERQANAAPAASFQDGTLFDTVDGAACIPETAWVNKDWKKTVLIKGGDKPQPLSARAAFGAAAQGLDVVVEVKDAVHFQEGMTDDPWNGDSLQIAWDCENTGVFGGNTEMVFALTDKGPLAWKIFAAEPKGNIPGRWSPARGPAKFVETAITRDGDVTRYQLRIPWSELYPLTYQPDKPLHVAVVVNDNDGNGRAGYLEWASGIAQEKDPSRYGTLKPNSNKAIPPGGN